MGLDERVKAIPLQQSFRVCEIPFQVGYSQEFSSVFSSLLSEYSALGAGSYSARFQLPSASKTREIDLSRYYSITECESFVDTRPVGDKKFEFVVQLPHPYLVSAALGILLSLGLAGNGGVLVHASAFLWREKAYVFVGPSGAGKSTIVRNARGTVYLNDDRLAIRRMEDGWRAFGTPMSDNDRQPSRNLSAPLGGVFLIEKSDVFSTSRASTSDYLSGLFPQVLMPVAGLRIRKQVAESAMALIDDVGCSRLRFPRDGDVAQWFGKVGI